LAPALNKARTAHASSLAGVACDFVAVDLGSVDRKVEWAEQHIGDLEAQLRVFHRGKPYEFVTQQHPQKPQRSQLLLRIHKPIPHTFELRIGDVVHNLRSALDHLACLAVERNGAVVTTNTAFPICRDPGTPTPLALEALIRRQVRGASTSFMRQVLRLQPYEGGDDEPLWCVNRLDIMDKHHQMIPALATYEYVHLDLGAIAGTALGVGHLPGGVLSFPPTVRFPLNDGEVLFEATADEVAQAKPKFTIEVSLGEPKVLEGKPVVPMLADLTQAVRGVIDLFRSLI